MNDYCSCVKRIPSGRRYNGEETCTRCDLTFLVSAQAKKRHREFQRENLGRLAFTSAIVPDMQQLRVDLHSIIPGLRHPSHYKGVGGSATFKDDEAVSYLSRGYAEGDERLELVARLNELLPKMPLRSVGTVIDLISFLRG